MRSPILLLHIIAGTLGMLSGFVAVFLRKGSRRHGVAGNVFVVAMLCLSASGVYLAVMKSQPGNILGGTLTFYLVATAWMTARRRDGEPGVFDWGALLVVSAVAAFNVTWGFQAATSPAGLKHDYPQALTSSSVPWPCLLPSVTFACSCATGFLARNVSRGIFGACASRCSSRRRPSSWHGNKYSPLSYARPAHSFCSVFCR